MYLKRISANGFKSFAEKINIVLDNNITCVVGPNGSGKSNIVDAIRWVLGEQSVKSLRGSNAMSDIIFTGSKSRSGANRAEVSLVFDNNNHELKTDFNEVEIKRVLYRTGESEYFLNGSKVRLKDITDLFLDTGVVVDSFNIISQGSIESVINSKPIERRSIIEEAAGVLKYKKRKEETIKKLEKTKENIEKVNLILEELKVTIEPLKLQSENAKKYLELKEELQGLEVATITSEITSIHEVYSKLQSEIEEINTKLVKQETSSSDTASKLEMLKLKNVRLDEEISESNKKLLDLTSKFVNLQNESNMYKERKKLRGSKKEVENNIVSLKEEILELDGAVQVLDNELKNMRDTLKQTENNLRDIDEQISFSKIKKNTLQNKFQNNTKDLFALKSKREVLENNLENDTKLPNAVRNVLNNVRLQGIYNTIGKLIEIPEEYSRAIEVALGASAHFIVVEQEKHAKEAIQFLKENKLGRATFFPLGVIKERWIPEDILERLEKIDGFVGIASDLISFDEKFSSIMKNQLGQVIVVKNMDAMAMIGRILEYKYRIVTLDGEIMHAGGSLTGGENRKESSSLQDKRELEITLREIQEKETENEKLEKEIADFNSELAILEEKEEELNRNVIHLTESIHEKETFMDTKKQKQLSLSKELEGSEALQDGSVDKKLMALLDEVSEAETQKNIMTANLEKLNSERNDLVVEIETLEKKNREKNTAYNRLQTDLKNKEVQIGKYDIQLDNLLVTLNENYNLTYEKAKLEYTLEMEESVAKAKVITLKQDIQKLGEVNVFAIEEFDRVNTRFEFLTHQKEDLNSASENLLQIIEEMDTIMIEKFKSTFEAVSKEFSSVFRKLFKGGEGMLKLTDPENLLETGIEIVAEPPGKKLNSIGLLSGGEKTLTAISLLFAVLNVKTVPFCILDEIEAALDEANVDAFGKYLQEYKTKSQFVLITHKKRTMEYADTLYGITMQESGVSKVVSVSLENVK